MRTKRELNNMAKLTFRIWVLIIALMLALLMISPSFKSGVVIKSVDKNSTASNNGLQQGMRIIGINGNPVENVEDYAKEVSFYAGNISKKIEIKTAENEFIFLTNQAPEISVANVPMTKIKTGLDLSGGARALVKPVNATLS